MAHRHERATSEGLADDSKQLSSVGAECVVPPGCAGGFFAHRPARTLPSESPCRALPGRIEGSHREPAGYESLLRAHPGPCTLRQKPLQPWLGHRNHRGCPRSSVHLAQNRNAQLACTALSARSNALRWQAGSVICGRVSEPWVITLQLQGRWAHPCIGKFSGVVSAATGSTCHRRTSATIRALQNAFRNQGIDQ